MKRCVVFLDCFPYSSKETFFEKELPYLSRAFDEVILLPLHSPTNSIRKCPINVKVYSLNISDMLFKKTRKMFAGLFSKDVKIEEHKFKNRLYEMYFKGGAVIGARRALKILKKYNIDSKNTIIYSYWFGLTALISVIVREKLKHNLKIVSRAHGVDLYNYRSPLKFNPFQLKLLNEFDYVCPISEDGVFYLRNKYRKIKSEIKLFRLGTENKGQLINNHLKSSHTIATCSNIIKLKRLDIVLDALYKLKNGGLSIKWICIGDGPEMNSLKKEALAKGISENVDFLGWIANEEVTNVYKNKQVALFINVSTFEGIPVSIMEAMSCGIPCIATDVGGTKEIVNESNGFLLNRDDDSDALCLTIKNYFTLNEKHKISKSNYAFKTWLEKYSSEKNFKEFSNFLISLLE